MKTRVLILMSLIFGFYSCEPEEIEPVEYTTEHIIAEPADGGGGGDGGGNTFTSTIDATSFVEGVSNVNSEMTGVVTLFAYDDSGENGFQIWFPLLTMTVGDHALTYPATGGYGFTCLKEGSTYHPSGDPGNTITITTYDEDSERIEGSFSLRMEKESGGVFLDNVEGEFGINY